MKIRWVPPLFALALATFVSAGPLEIRRAVEHIPERGPVPKFIVRSGEHSFSFILPSSWTIQLQPEAGRIVARDNALGAGAHIAFLPVKKGKQPPSIQTRFAEFPEATKNEEFTCYSRDAEGPVVEGLFGNSGGSRNCIRLGHLPYGEIIIEIACYIPIQNENRLHSIWTSLLNSFHAEPPL